MTAKEVGQTILGVAAVSVLGGLTIWALATLVSVVVFIYRATH